MLVFRNVYTFDVLESKLDVVLNIMQDYGIRTHRLKRRYDDANIVGHFWKISILATDIEWKLFARLMSNNNLFM